MIQSIGAHALALLLYPGLVTVAVFGVLAELVWNGAAEMALLPSRLKLRRPPPGVVVAAVLAMLAVTQAAAPFNPVPAQERNLIIALAALALMLWATERLPEHGSLQLAAQVCWVVAVLASAVEPQELRPSVLGSTLVAGLLPLKATSAILYLLCLPVLLRLVPRSEADQRRGPARFDGARALRWLPHCALFATLYFPPGADSAPDLARFFGACSLAAAAAIGLSLVLRARSPQSIPAFYRLVAAPFAVLVVGLAAGTSLLMR